ncbi:AAA domain-containing protein isoform X2 [Spatholobus suberectus]|nr:AAA domain-containing protein isoform X2 [Spatholobus suberectus]
MQRGEGTAMKPEAKSENAAPVKKAEAETSTSVEKADGEKSVPAPKAADKKQKAAKGQNRDVQDSQGGQSIVGNTQDGEEEDKQERVITLRSLNMQDFKEAKNQ